MGFNFEKFGLSNKESRIYKALLELGCATVTEITQLATIQRTTGYDILNSLIKKELVFRSRKGKKTVYLVENPKRFIKYLESKTNSWQQKLKMAKKLLPELKAIYNPISPKPKVKYFEGIEGLKQVYEDSLTSKGTIRAYASIEDLKKVLPDYAEDYFRRRVKKGIYIYSIVKTSPYAVHLKRIQKKFLREMLLMPPDKFDLSLEAYIYDNKVSFVSLEEKFGVIIESREIAQAQKCLYELAWQRARDYDKREEKKLRQKNTNK